MIGSSVCTLPDDVKNHLKAIYREVDAEVAKINPECQTCGRCCDFVSFGHQHWLTHFELLLLIGERGLRRPGGDGACPYQEDGLCSAHEVRALGCRVFSCEADLGASQDLYERFLTRIRRLADEAGLELYYGELLTSLKEIVVPPLPARAQAGENEQSRP